jgi:hypothetical protein
MQRIICTMTALLLFIMTHAVYAAGTEEIESDFRCGTYLVSKMDQSFQVLQKCGEPQSKENISGADGPVMEKWVYGPSEGYYTILTFRDDVLIGIKQVSADE